MKSRKLNITSKFRSSTGSFPRETWRRCMEREMKDVGMTWVALSKKAQDRDVWRMFVCVAYTLTGMRGNDDDDWFIQCERKPFKKKQSLRH